MGAKRLGGRNVYGAKCPGAKSLMKSFFHWLSKIPNFSQWRPFCFCSNIKIKQNFVGHPPDMCSLGINYVKKRGWQSLTFCPPCIKNVKFCHLSILLRTSDYLSLFAAIIISVHPLSQPLSFKLSSTWSCVSLPRWTLIDRYQVFARMHLHLWISDNFLLTVDRNWAELTSQHTVVLGGITTNTKCDDSPKVGSMLAQHRNVVGWTSRRVIFPWPVSRECYCVLVGKITCFERCDVFAWMFSSIN